MHRGQALIELALASALLALLLAAAVDAGLAYRSYQTLVNASAEASSLLAQRPYAGTPPTIAGADSLAQAAFRDEQGGSREGTSAASATITIDEADHTQVKFTGGVYGIDATYDPSATNTQCKNRQNTRSTGEPCYIVVQSSMVYKPFFLTPVFGKQLAISTVSIKPIVGFPVNTVP
jgi:Flp pilus assembly protein TadG